jgi:hypothetical protein
VAQVLIELKAKTQQAEKDLEEVSVLLEEQKELTIEFQKELSELERKRATSNKGNLAQQREINKAIAQTKAQIKDAQLGVKDYSNQQSSLRKTQQKLNKETREAEKDQKEYNRELEKSTGLTKTLDTLTGGLFSRVKSGATAFKTATKSANRFRIALISTGVGAFVVALGSLVAMFKNSEEGQDRLTKLTKQFGSVVNNVLDVVSDFGKGIFNLGNAFKTALSDGLMAGLREAKDGFSEFSDSVSTFTEEVVNDFEKAGQIADQIAEANKIDRALLIERQKANAKINDLRIKGQDIERFNAFERADFLAEALRIENEITDQEIKAAKLRRDAKIEENKLSESTREDLEEQAKLEAKVFELESKKLSRQREVRSSINTAIRETIRLRRQEIQEFGEQREKIQAVQDEFQAKKDKQAEEDGEKQQEAKALEINNALEVSQSILRGKIMQSEEELFLEEHKAELTMGFANQTSQLIGMIAKKDSKVAKAAATAQAIISGIQGTQNAFKTAQDSPITALFPPYPFIQAGIAAAFAIKQVQSINAVDPTGGSGASMSGARGSAQSQVPSVNVVGASPINQVAQAIGTREDQPVKAFVVAEEVTTQQALDRKTNEKASIG